MTSEVVLLISILCLVKCTWCGNYGFAMGKRHSNDQILHEELLTYDSDSNEAIIEYIYMAEKPVTCVQLRTDTNIYTEVSFINSTKIYIKLSNFENLNFNATLTVYGFPWYPDGPVPDDDIEFLLQPNLKKSIYLNKSSVEASDLIATNGAYMSQEINTTNEDSNVSEENDSISTVESDSGEYYDYDFTSTLEEETDGVEDKPESIINVNTTSIAENRSVLVKVNFLNYIFIWIVFVSLL
ncbi:uncharacterized protein LOC119085783 [Bradysia coprophila]|uniref:uncharacterized protein LOC119085783 n=1 Tax=Bradysia coprophila TaxID=38358 RepID=UPI00187DB4D2|nr:uncharacterized protein LOC119085783 [Bradysia coprophila]